MRSNPGVSSTTTLERWRRGPRVTDAWTRSARVSPRAQVPQFPGLVIFPLLRVVSLTIAKD